jgi:hypothetical protein
VITIGQEGERARQFFRTCDLVGRVTHRFGVENEKPRGSTAYALAATSAGPGLRSGMTGRHLVDVRQQRAVEAPSCACGHQMTPTFMKAHFLCICAHP